MGEGWIYLSHYGDLVKTNILDNLWLLSDNPIRDRAEYCWRVVVDPTLYFAILTLKIHSRLCWILAELGRNLQVPKILRFPNLNSIEQI